MAKLKERDKARNAISKILKSVDYDLWKSYLHEPSFERETEEVEEEIETLIDVLLKEMKNDKS